MQKLALVALAVSLTACEAAKPPVSPSTPTIARTAFVGVTVLTMEPADDPGAKLPEQTVIVAGDRIETVGPRTAVHVPDGARTIDGHGKFLVPGLIDMHVHLTHEEQLPLYVARGVTTVRNMWGAPMHLAWRDAIAKHALLGPRIRTAGPIVDGKDPVHDGSFQALTPEDADRAVALHVAAGYDFVKAYAKLEPAVFERLVERARAAHLPVVGHVPREVGLMRSLELGLASVEHTNTFYDALQADDSPVKGKTDRASRLAWALHLDESKLPAIAQRFVDRHAFACPTRVVLSSWEPRETQLAKLARPESRYVLPSERAIWEPGKEPLPPEEQKRNARDLEVADAIMRELHRRGVPVLPGTDVGNPLLVPGYALHDELAEFVRVGFTPYETLRAATHDAAEALGLGGETGTITPDKSADVVLLAADPRADIHNTTRIEGVMAHGVWIDAHDGEELLAGVARWAEGHDDPFAKRPALGTPGREKLFAATFGVSWKGTPFDAERVLIESGESGGRRLVAEAYDPHEGRWTRFERTTGGEGPVLAADRFVLDVDGTSGRGHVEITRVLAAKLHVVGTLASGDAITTDLAIDPEAILVVDHFLAGYLALPQGETPKEGRDVKIVSLALGSTVSAEPSTWKLTSDGDGTRTEVVAGKGEPRILERDGAGNPVRLAMKSHGGPLEWRRVP